MGPEPAGVGAPRAGGSGFGHVEPPVPDPILLPTSALTGSHAAPLSVAKDDHRAPRAGLPPAWPGSPACSTARDPPSAHFHDAVDIHQFRRTIIFTTISLYNQNDMEMRNIPEFYTGAPVDPVDLRFRGTFLAELGQTLRTGHVVLTAPRRTGKTSVMDYLRDHPENGYSVVSINVQDLAHPADFFQVLRSATAHRSPGPSHSALHADGDPGSLTALKTRATQDRRDGCRYRRRRDDRRFRRPHPIAALPFADPAVLSGSETLDCPCLAGTNLRERIGAEAGRPVAGDGTGGSQISAPRSRAQERRQIFNQLLLDLENDFYIVEVEGGEGFHDFASGVLKSWWRKYHA